MSAVLSGRALSITPVWRRSLVVLALLLPGLLLLYRDTAVAMERVWANSETFAHAYLVLPISLWLVWRLRGQLAALLPRPEPWALLPMLALTLPWLLSQMVAVNAVAQFSLVAMLILAVLLVCGRQVFKALLFPLLFLFFAVPVGDFLLPMLMEGTADFTVAALRVTGIPVYREGLQFVIPSGAWSVVEACSGVRYLIASVMVGALFAYLNYRSMGRRLVFVGVSILVPIAANWLRAYIIVMLGHLSNNKIATGVDHLVYGWVFFGVVITIMFMIGARWSEPDEPPHEGQPPVASAAALQAAGWHAGLWSGLVLAALAVPPQLLSRIDARLAAPRPAPELQLPRTSAWVLGADRPAWAPRFEGARATWQGVFQRDGARVGVHVYYYRQQAPGSRLVSSLNILDNLEDGRWNQLRLPAASSAVQDQTITWRATELLDRSSLSGSRQRMTVWQTYWVDGEFTASDVRAKLLGARGLLLGRDDDGAAIVLHVERGPHDGATALLADFAGSTLVDLRAALQRARDSH